MTNPPTKRPDQCTYETNSQLCESPRCMGKVRAMCEKHQRIPRHVVLAYPSYDLALKAEANYRRMHYCSHIWQDRFVVIDTITQPSHFFEGTFGVMGIYEAHRYEDALDAAIFGELRAFRDDVWQSLWKNIREIKQRPVEVG